MKQVIDTRLQLQVQITVIDKRAVFASSGAWEGIKGGPYTISIILKV